MSTRTSATRYAKALLDVTPSDADATAVEQSLASVVGLMDGHAELRQSLMSPSVPASAKRGIVSALAAKVGMTGPSTKLVQLLADRDRLALLPDVLGVFRERLLDRRKIVRAELRSAVALAPDAVAAIERKLSAATGRNVSVKADVDPTLIGGVIAQVGSTVYDGSVKSQLERLRKQLVGQG